MTLIEVMLALTILLLSTAAIGQLVGIGSDRADDTRRQVRGTRLAEARMAEVEAGVVAFDSPPGETKFEDDPDWSSTVDIQPAGPANLYQVTVTVSRDVKGKKFEVALSQMVLDPATVGSAAQAERPAEAADTTGGTMP